MLLTEFVVSYGLQRDVGVGAREQLTIVAKQLESFLAGKHLEEITSDDINRWCASLLCRNARVTVSAKIGRVRTLLKAAKRARLRGPLDGPLRKVKVPKQIVRALTPAEVNKLLETFAKIPRWWPTTGLKKSDFMVTYTNAGWDTCFRMGDILTLRFTDLRDVEVPETGEIAHVAVKVYNKTGNVAVRRLRDVTWEGIQKLRRQGSDEPDRYIFQHTASRGRFYKMIREAFADAGVQGTSKYIRRGRATKDYILRGKMAAVETLGHSDDGRTAMASYIDLSQVACNLRLPPEIA